MYLPTAPGFAGCVCLPLSRVGYQHAAVYQGFSSRSRLTEPSVTRQFEVGQRRVRFGYKILYRYLNLRQLIGAGDKITLNVVPQKNVRGEKTGGYLLRADLAYRFFPFTIRSSIIFKFTFTSPQISSSGPALNFANSQQAASYYPQFKRSHQ